MDFEERIQEIRDKCFITKYENMKSSCTDENIKMKITDILTNNILVKEHKKNKLNNTEIHSNIFERLYQIDTLIFKQSWNNLHEIHKIMKITEYIELLKHKYKLGNIDIIRDSLIEDVKNKKLNGKSKLLYDSLNGKIISITCLKIDEEQCTITYK